MVAPTAGLLRSPSRPGFVSPQAVLQLASAVDTICGPDAREDLLRDARLFRLPAPDEPVREEKVARLHRAVWDTLPQSAVMILDLAGKTVADHVADVRITRRGRTLLSGLPWPLAAWILGRFAGQHAWTFAGSGEFRILTTLSFELSPNPFLRGMHADGPVCHYHRALIGRLYQRLVNPHLACTEIACIAHGAPACRFVLTA